MKESGGRPPDHTAGNSAGRVGVGGQYDDSWREEPIADGRV